jgi:hypothetical protein
MLLQPRPPPPTHSSMTRQKNCQGCWLILFRDRRRHRVGRVLSFFPVAGIGTPPTPHPPASVPPPPPPVLGAGAHWLAREGWESPNSDEWTMDIHCGTLNIYVLCGRRALSKIESAGNAPFLANFFFTFIFAYNRKKII